MIYVPMYKKRTDIQNFKLFRIFLNLKVELNV